MDKIKLALMNSDFIAERHKRQFMGMVIIFGSLFFWEGINPENSTVLKITVMETNARNPHNPPKCMTDITMEAKTMALITLFQNIFWILGIKSDLKSPRISCFSAGSPKSPLKDSFCGNLATTHL